MQTASGLTLPTSLYGELLWHARSELPREAVGLLGGSATGHIMVVLPLANIAAGDKAFLADPFEQFRALRRLRAEKLQLLAIYHSHPGGGAIPSADDLAYAKRWRCAHVIVALGLSGDVRLMAFRCDTQDCLKEVDIRLSSQAPSQR